MCVVAAHIHRMKVRRHDVAASRLSNRKFFGNVDVSGFRTPFAVLRRSQDDCIRFISVHTMKSILGSFMAVLVYQENLLKSQ